MIYKLLVPGPIDDVEQVRVLEWHVAPGDACEIGQLVVELETHKALVEVRAEQAAVLRSILSEGGEWVAVGAPMALLSDDADEPLPDSLDALADLPLAFEVN